MFKMNPMFCGDPLMVVVAGSAVAQNTGSAAINTVVPSVLFRAPANTGGAAIGQNESIAPQGCKVNIVINPTPAYAPGVATGANQNVVLLDLRAYPGDIVSVTASLVAPVSGTAGALNLTGYDASVVGIDQSNNFVYLLCTTAAGGAQAFANGMAIHYAVFFKDGYAP